MVWSVGLKEGKTLTPHSGNTDYIHSFTELLGKITVAKNKCCLAAVSASEGHDKNQTCSAIYSSTGAFVQRTCMHARTHLHGCNGIL